MSSINVSLSGDNSSLSTNFGEQFEFDDRFDYSCCLLDFSIQIPSNLTAVVDNSNKTLTYKYNSMHMGFHNTIELTTGTHTLEEIAKDLEKKFKANDHNIKIWFDESTMKYNIEPNSNIEINFRDYKDVGAIFGFEPRIIQYGRGTEADHRMGKFKDVSRIRVDCDLVFGSFYDGVCTHTIHDFYPDKITNYKLTEQPKHLIYLPVVKRIIKSINVTIADQNGNPINFATGTRINCRFNIKKLC